MISVIIPAHNEEHYISECLDSLLMSTDPDGAVQIIVVANGCHDATVPKAREKAAAFAKKRWEFSVLELEQGSKIAALNTGDAAAKYDRRVYIDFDIVVSPQLLAQLAEALDRPKPAYASGSIEVPPARSFLSRRYAGFWQKLPFIRQGVPGCGVFAVNAAGRARWTQFPDIISDDSFVRFHFAPDEMHRVPATFLWPITEGFTRLVRVRRRQNQGLDELHRLYPDLGGDLVPTAPGMREKLSLLLRDPVGFAIYASVAVTVRLPILRNRGGWDRGR